MNTVCVRALSIGLEFAAARRDFPEFDMAAVGIGSVATSRLGVDFSSQRSFDQRGHDDTETKVRG
mgnify:CR=1 FL=1